MNAFDLGIVGVLLIAIVFGAMRGFWLTVFEYVGVALGLVAGATIAPKLLEHVPIEATGLRVAIVLLLLGGGSALGSSLLHLAGEPVRALVDRLPIAHEVDRAAGALLTGAVTLGIIWYVGQAVAHGPLPEVATQAQRSSILQRLNAFAPAPPASLTQLQEQLAGDLLPQLFAGLEPSMPGGAQPDPANVQSAAVQRAAASTVKIQAPGCGGVNYGSGAVIAPGHVLTNAHVVAGTRSVGILVPGSTKPLPASVVAFDPARDAAVLAVPGLTLPALGTSIAKRGTQAVILGYPGGGLETTVAAVVQGEIRGEGRDIYDQTAVNRDILVLSGPARPGNSGGPLVDLEGRMIGLVFAGSISRPDQSYALALGEVLPAIEAASTSSGRLDMRTYQCVS